MHLLSVSGVSERHLGAVALGEAAALLLLNAFTAASNGSTSASELSPTVPASS
jgi:hypothetical protein